VTAVAIDASPHERLAAWVRGEYAKGRKRDDIAWSLEISGSHLRMLVVGTLRWPHLSTRMMIEQVVGIPTGSWGPRIHKLQAIRKDWTGVRIDRAVAVECSGRIREWDKTYAMWRFRCDCGRTFDISGSRLGATKVRKRKSFSCGCVRWDLNARKIVQVLPPLALPAESNCALSPSVSSPPSEST